MTNTVSAAARVRQRVLLAASQLSAPVDRRPLPVSARILIIRPDDLGDLVLASPALARLRAALPSAHVTLAIGPWARAVLPHLPPVDDVLVIPFTGVSRTTRRSRLEPYTLLWQAARQVRTGHFDAALVLRPDHWWGAWLVHLAGVPRRLGYAASEVVSFLTDALPMTPGQHATERNLALIDRLLGEDGPRDPEGAPLVFSADEAAHTRARGLLAGLSSTRPRIAIHPGAGNPIKQWPSKRWVAVATSLAADGAAVVVTGGAGEAELAVPIAAALEESDHCNLVGQTDLGVLAAVFATCDLVMGVDSGALHIATAVAPRTLRLYGPSDWVEFGPWGSARNHRALWAGLQCSDCHHLNRSGVCQPDCMSALTVADVTTAARALMSEGTVGRDGGGSSDNLAS